MMMQSHFFSFAYYATSNKKLTYRPPYNQMIPEHLISWHNSTPPSNYKFKELMIKSSACNSVAKKKCSMRAHIANLYTVAKFMLYTVAYVLIKI